MLLKNKSLSEITEQDLRLLIENGEPEGKKLDYKRELPGNSDGDKRKFLADICAFANAGGGFIIYGMEEEAGKGIALPGINEIDIDKEKLRLESIYQSGISPRVPGIALRGVDLSNGAFVLIIKIPLSWASPHMVTFEGASKFYSRNSAGNYQLDVQEIRAAFTASDALSNGIKNFRLNRVGKIVAGETPMHLGEGAKIILHLLPLSVIQERPIVDIGFIADNYSTLKTIYTDVLGYRINLDGIVTYSQLRDDRYLSYSQLFRDGSIEAVDDFFLQNEHEEKPKISMLDFEKEIIDTCSKFLGLQNRIGVEPPINIMLTLVGLKGYTIAINQEIAWGMRHSMIGREIDRDTLMIPEVVVQSYENIRVDRLLKPAFDAIWNAAGWLSSSNYDKDGNWIERNR